MIKASAKIIRNSSTRSVRSVPARLSVVLSVSIRMRRLLPRCAQLDEVLERKSRHVLGHGDMAKSLELMEKMRDEGASDHEIDVALAEAKLPLGRAGWS